MLETYKIGVTLEMAGNAQAGIDRLLGQMEKLDQQVKDTGSSFAKLAESVRAIGNAGRSIQSLSRAMEKLTTGGGKGITDMERMATAARAMTSASERLTGVLRENARLTADMAKASEAAARASTGGGTGRGGRAGGGLGARAGGGHDWMLTGIGASMLGEPLLRGGESAFERGMEVGHLRTQILADKRVSEAQADQLIAKAYDATASAPGTRVASNIHAAIDLKNVTGSLEEAEALLPRFARLTALLQVMDKKKGGSGDGAFAAAKAMEVMGGMIDERQVDGRTVREINPELMQQRLDMMARVAVATNSRIGPQDYLGFAKQARVAGMNLSDSFIYERLPAIMLGMGGPRAGTALMGMAQVFEGGKLTAKSMEALQGIGLASEAGITMEGQRRNRRGEMVGGHAAVHSEAIYDLALMRTDPDKWVAAAQVRMEGKGIHGSADQITALMRASQRSTIAGILADMLKDQPAIQKEAENIRNTRPDVASYFAQNDPAAKLQQMQAAFDKLTTTLGSSAMDDAVKLMNAVTAGLNSLSAWAEAHPTMARVLTDTGIAMGALATGLGTLSTAIFVFGPALRLLGIGGAAGAAAGGGGLAGAAGVAAGAAAGVAAGVGGAAIGGALMLGNSVDPIAAQQQLERINRLLRPQAPSNLPTFDGYGPDGQPVPRSLVPPPVSGAPSGGKVELHGDINMDGRKVGELVAYHIGRTANAAPRSGATGSDLRASPWGGSIGI